GGHYQPLTWMTLGLDYTVWGMNPVGYHLTNLLLHVANALLFYRLLLLLLRWPVVAGPRTAYQQVAAGVGALLFAIHPLPVEAVAWATERRVVLAGSFYLMTLIAYVRRAAAEREGGAAGRWLVVSLACFTLSLASKVWGITLPVVLVVLDLYPLRRGVRPLE